MSEFNQNQYINKYIKEKYDRINLTMKAGKKEKIKSGLHGKRLSLPPNKRHKSKKDYKRNNKIKPHEIDKD